jgi:small-conductance mechanosensitive channel
VNLAEYMANMDTIGIGLWITGFMMLLIIIGVRVAFAAALAGFAGLLWVFSASTVLNVD